MECNKRGLTINVGGRLMDVSRPKVMGIVNATPDSFYSASRHRGADAAREAGIQLAAGADILDIGACSTRHGSQEVSAEVEMERLRDALGPIREKFPEAIISVDTWRAGVARRCVEEFGVDIINDISGGDYDPDMFATVAELKVPYVLMHTRGVPATMSQLTDYEDVTADVLRALAFKLDELRQLGVCDVIIDPGFGFAKDIDQNYQLLANLPAFSELGCPLLVGASRKRFVWQLLGITPEDALPGTVAVNTLALVNGADILRVHDVAAAVQARGVAEAYLRNAPTAYNTIERFSRVPD